MLGFFCSSRRRHTRCSRDWSSDVCSSDLKPEGGSVLEVGCGPGLMLAAFRRRGWRVFGIERNEAAAETARQTLGPNTIATSMEGLPADARFDLIVLFQVLEHIGEPVALLREYANLLA